MRNDWISMAMNHQVCVSLAALRPWRRAFVLLLLPMLLATGSPLALDSWQVEYVGCLPGNVVHTEVQGDLACCAAQNGLLVLDIADPTTPTQVSFLPLTGAFSLAWQNRYAYVSANTCIFMTHGLTIVDLADPAAPVPVGFFETGDHPSDVVLANDVVCLADCWIGVRIIDVSTPQSPVEIGLLPVSSKVEDLEWDGGLLYVADVGAGLRIVDLSEPTQPTELGRFDPGYAVEAVAVMGTLAYIACTPGIRIVDVSNPAAPVQVGSYTCSGVRSIAIVDGYAYLSHYDEVRILDLSVPTSPTLVDIQPIYGRTWSIVETGDGVALAADFGGLQTFDVEASGQLTQIGRYVTVGDVYGLSLQGERVYLAGGYQYADEKASPRGAPARPMEEWRGFAGLYSVDLSHPAIPRTISYRPFGNAIHLQVVEPLVYMVDYMGRLGIYDVSNPSAPVRLSVTDLPYRVVRLAVAGHYAYALTEEYGLHILDVGDPESPVEVGEVDAGTNDVAVQGDFAYVAHYYYGLSVIDISDPATPQVMGTCSMPIWMYGLDVEGDFAYAADAGAGLFIVDVSDPTNPIVVGSYDTPGVAHHVVVQDGLAYVADGEGGVRVIDVTDPYAPEEIAYFVTPWAAWEIAVQGDRIVVGSDGGGFLVLQRETGSHAGEEPSDKHTTRLYQNQPNPFTAQTSICFRLPQASDVRLDVFSPDGRRAAGLIDGHFSPGAHVVAWTGRDDQGRDLPPGAYLYRLVVGEQAETRKLQLLK